VNICILNRGAVYTGCSKNGYAPSYLNDVSYFSNTSMEIILFRMLFSLRSRRRPYFFLCRISTEIARKIMTTTEDRNLIFFRTYNMLFYNNCCARWSTRHSAIGDLHIFFGPSKNKNNTVTIFSDNVDQKKKSINNYFIII